MWEHRQIPFTDGRNPDNLYDQSVGEQGCAGAAADGYVKGEMAAVGRGGRGDKRSTRDGADLRAGLPPLFRPVRERSEPN
jgi:hypothetical protein